jgi:AcrR family transcriptional regulator
MAQIKVIQGPGRPRVRPDRETRQAIYEAARYEFARSGYAGTSMETVAYRAGVSTKTLYRLFSNKAALFEGTMSDRLDPLGRQPRYRGSRKHRRDTVWGADNLYESRA